MTCPTHLDRVSTAALQAKIDAAFPKTAATGSINVPDTIVFGCFPHSRRVGAAHRHALRPDANHCAPARRARARLHDAALPYPP